MDGQKMTTPAETEAALRALRFTDTAHGDRLPEGDVVHYLRFARESVAQIEKAMHDNWHPEMNSNREQILAVLRPHVRWLDANPAEDPQIKDARFLPTSVLKEVLRERKAAERKARRLARKKRDGHLPLTEEDKQAMRGAAERLKDVPFAETPGRKATYPSRNGNNFVDVPVVVLDNVNGQHLARLRGGAITMLPADWPLDFVDDETWARALANEQESAGGAK